MSNRWQWQVGWTLSKWARLEGYYLGLMPAVGSRDPEDAFRRAEAWDLIAGAADVQLVCLMSLLIGQEE
jgi:hypothetical protein